MHRRRSKLLPFGDKNAVMVIVFLVLSLGVGALRDELEIMPASSPHPSLMTINQTTQGFLGVEKLVYLNVDGAYFVDEPKFRPSGLSTHSIADIGNFVPLDQIEGDYKEVALGRTLANGSIFRTSGATLENTRVASGIITDTEITLEKCVSVLLSETPFVSSGGKCIPAQNLTRGDRIWGDIRSIAVTGRFRCFAGRCNYDRQGKYLSFSGVGSAPWNGAALSFENRSAFKSSTDVLGMVCGLEGTAQNSALKQIREIQREAENVIYYGNSSFWLFSGDIGFSYLENRLISNARTNLEMSVFDPNKRESISQYLFHFDGLQAGSRLPDGVLFSDKKSCENINDYLQAASVINPENRPSDYPHQILRLFKLEIKAGKIAQAFGVDRIENR